MFQDDGLNEKCGADFVKVGQKIPKNFEKFVNGERCVTIDGDADRVIYFYTTEEEGFVMLDGDRIATLSKFFVVFSRKKNTGMIIILLFCFKSPDTSWNF